MRKLFALIEGVCDEERYFKISTLRVGGESELLASLPRSGLQKIEVVKMLIESTGQVLYGVQALACGVLRRVSNDPHTKV